MIEALETGITSPSHHPLPGQRKPQHSLRSPSDQYPLYALAVDPVRTLAPHTEAQPEAILLQLALDRSPVIQLPHLQAALALWDYCSYSAGSLFGSSVADSVADRILEALQAADHGLTRKQIRDLFRGHLGSSSIDQALEKLRSLGLATYRYVPGRGLYSTLWSAADYQDPEPAEEETAGLEEFLWEEP